MRVGIVGNCQSIALSRCLAAMLPEDEIVHHSITRPPETFDAAAKELAQCDVLMSQMIGPDQGALATQLLKDSGPRFVMLPNFSFTGFQPDMTYLTARGIVAASPVGAYHSRLIASCFLLGLDAGRTAALFNSHVFALLGYFDEFDKAEAHLEESSANLGFSLTVRDLMKQGAFMHTINHCAISAAEELARQAAALIGRTPRADVGPFEDPMADDTIWPVYPQIAHRIGLAAGCTDFTVPAHFRPGQSRTMSLDTMIRDSFAIYNERRVDLDFAPVQPQAETLRAALKSGYS